MKNPSDVNPITSDKRLPIFEKILTEIDRRKSRDRPFVVGITGIDAAGKTLFTEALENHLITKNRHVQVISLDDFHNPRQVRYNRENQAENYFHRSFNIKSIVETLLIPIRRDNKYSIKLNLLDLNTDKYENRKQYSFQQDTIVIIEGVFLFRKELSPYIDYRVFLDISFEECERRAIARNIPVCSDDVLRKYDEKYLPAQEQYLKKYLPQEAADMLIDNNNWKHPYKQ